MTKKIQAPLIVTAHTNADFDALAAMVAASRLYPGAVLVFPGSQEKNLRNFFIQSAMYMFNFKAAKEIDIASVQTLVAVDTRQVSRMSHVAGVFDNPDLVIHAFDHHPDSDEDVAYIHGKVLPWGSTAAIITLELRDKGIELTTDEATIIGLGIYEDTGSFTFSSTTVHDLEAAAWLMTQGMDVGLIADLITRDLSAEQISILNQLLEAAQTHEIRGVPVMVTEVTTEEYVGDFALLVHKLMDMENIRVLFALGRMHDRVHLVARSRSADVNVGQICASFGGGGHSYAASASIKDRTPAQVKDELFALLYSHINPQILVRDKMSRTPVTLDADRPMSEAMEIMTRYGLKAMPILEPGGDRPVGVLEHHLADKAVGHGLGDMAVSEYMMQDFETVAPDKDLYQVIELILGQGQRLVPVVEEEQIVGVITRTDLINLLIEEPARIPESRMPERSRERNIRVMMRERLPADVLDLLQAAGDLAEELGCEVYAVGGFVRDILLGSPNFDLDLVVESDGIVYAEALAERLNGRVRAHSKFRTAVVIFGDDQRVDVATARLEYYEYPAALPTVELSSIKMDLYRRDFTINALAVQLNPKSFGRLVDFFGAQRDMKERTIRVLHSLSFIEDPTRILRAIRFEQRYDFKIGGQTERLIKNAVNLDMLRKLSGSRLFHELQLIFEERKAVDCLKRLREFKLLRAIHPLLILRPNIERVLDEMEKVLDWYRLLFLTPKARNWVVYFLTMCNGMPVEEVGTLLKRFNLPKRHETDFMNLRRTLDEVTYGIKRWQSARGNPSQLYFILENLPVEGVLYIMARNNHDEAVRRSLSMYLTKLRDLEPEVRGNDLKAMGLPPGPRYGAILRAVKAAALDGLAICRDDQLATAREMVRHALDQGPPRMEDVNPKIR